MKKNTQGAVSRLTCLCASDYVWNITECVPRGSTLYLPLGIQWNAASSVVYSQGCQSFTSNGTCVCPTNHKFNSTLSMCVIDCTSVPGSAGQDTLGCLCSNGTSWNITTLACNMDCTIVPFAIGSSLTNSSNCQCQNGFVWNSTQCQRNCTSVTNSTGTNFDQLD